MDMSGVAGMIPSGGAGGPDLSAIAGSLGSAPAAPGQDSAADLFQQLRCLQGDFEQRKACRAACTIQTCPLVLSYWGYQPNIPENSVFTAINVILMAIVLVIGVWNRRFKKYTGVMFIGSVMNIMGYVARIYAHDYPFSDISFITQLTTLTLSPAFYAAAIYFSLARIVNVFGEEFSRIPPKKIPRIFITCDVISLILQGSGGAYAAYLAQQEKMPDSGNYTMIAGLSFQALILLIFLCLAGDFAYKVMTATKKNPDAAFNSDPRATALRQSKRFRYLLWSLTISAILIFGRSIYRVIELSEGWKGELMTTEIYVLLLEAIPVAIAGLLLSVFHPAICFPDDDVPRDEEIKIQESRVHSGSQGSHQTWLKDNEKYSSKYGNVTVTYDPTFDRKNWL